MTVGVFSILQPSADRTAQQVPFLTILFLLQLRLDQHPIPEGRPPKPVNNNPSGGHALHLQKPPKEAAAIFAGPLGLAQRYLLSGGNISLAGPNWRPGYPTNR